jgi:RimJ/RimL family protein N-acetyltransferase
VLEANREHLGPWIPARVADPASVPVLAQRLAGFGAEFAANREWRYGLFALDDDRVMGEVALFPRSANGRVPFAESDRAELGYWLRSDEARRGFVTEAASAVLEAASSITRFSHIEIHCDARNTPSVAVARRLGFVLATDVASSASTHMQLWTWLRRAPA